MAAVSALERYQQARNNLWQKHLLELHKYLNDPPSYPSFKAEFDNFVMKRTSCIISLGASTDNYNFQAEFAKLWPAKIREILKAKWKIKEKYIKALYLKITGDSDHESGSISSSSEGSSSISDYEDVLKYDRSRYHDYNYDFNEVVEKKEESHGKRKHSNSSRETSRPGERSGSSMSKASECSMPNKRLVHGSHKRRRKRRSRECAHSSFSEGHKKHTDCYRKSSGDHDPPRSKKRKGVHHTSVSHEGRSGSSSSRSSSNKKKFACSSSENLDVEIKPDGSKVFIVPSDTESKTTSGNEEAPGGDSDSAVLSPVKLRPNNYVTEGDPISLHKKWSRPEVAYICNSLKSMCAVLEQSSPLWCIVNAIQHYFKKYELFPDKAENFFLSSYIFVVVALVKFYLKSKWRSSEAKSSQVVLVRQIQEFVSELCSVENCKVPFGFAVAFVCNLNVNALAELLKDEGEQVTLEFIKSLLVYKNISHVSDEDINYILIAVKDSINKGR